MSDTARHVARWLIPIHRYLGIAIGLLVAMWCASGIVMLYVPYPSLTEADRVKALPELDWEHCCRLPAADSFGDETVESFEIESVAGQPTLRLTLTDGEERLLDLDSGKDSPELNAGRALAIAADFAKTAGLAAHPVVTGLIDHDQWTVGDLRTPGPYFHVALNDASGTELYISSTTGKVAQRTTQHLRFWNWIGAVPHWLYLTVLRQHPTLWTEVVVWSSFSGVVLTVIGLYLGIIAYRPRGEGSTRSRSPYRGARYWHHLPGLIFGLFVLTWGLSGLLSMNPWGLLEGDSPQDDLGALRGPAPSWEQTSALIATIKASPLQTAVSYKSARLDGRSFVIASCATGTRKRFDAANGLAPLTDDDIESAAQRVASGAPASWRGFTSGDAYYYSGPGTSRTFPIARIEIGGDDPRFVYIDLLSAELLARVDAGDKHYRWWHTALHRFDVTEMLRAGELRRLLMVGLLIGSCVVTFTGVWLGARRIWPTRKRATVGRRSAPAADTLHT